jgi:Flp pilus assembly protein TadG
VNRAAAARRGRQRGAIGIMVALSAVVLLGFLGVVIDLGRLHVMKTELQNAADACALAAAFELDGNAGALTRAENAGIAVGTRNQVNFQSAAVAVTAADIRFSTTLSAGGGSNSNYLTQAAGAPADSKYVMCTLTLPGVPMTLTSLLGSGAQTVAGQAVATLAPAQSSCAIPLGVCTVGAGPTYGMSPGQWVSGRFDAGGGLTGSYNWIDFSPPAGGQSELAALLTGSGSCATTTSSTVGEAGVMGNAAAKAWNSRFGLYQNGAGNPQLGTAPPDFTGYSYTETSWPAQSNALPDFMNRRQSHAPYQGNASTGLDIGAAYNTSSAAQHASGGASRRLAVAPVVDCGGWASSQTVPIVAYACVLMLHPIGSVSDIVRMEFVGMANEPGSPCSTSGLAGGSFGPLVPVLVQ